MKEIEKKLRRGMTRKGINARTQEEIVEQIASFALYGFPESHAASFALIAYASAYLKCHYLAAFTAATLNNQPMGFYQPFTIIKDAQRHGLKVLPVDVTQSDWECTVERSREPGVGSRGNRGRRLEVRGQSQNAVMHRNGDAVSVIETPGSRLPAPGPCLRLGLLCVKGFREEAGRAIVRARAEMPFSSLDDLHRRVPELRKDELRKLAAVGALNRIEGVGGRGLGVGSGEIRGQRLEVRGPKSEVRVQSSEVRVQESAARVQESAASVQESAASVQESAVPEIPIGIQDSTFEKLP